MALRMVEVILPAGEAEHVGGALEGEPRGGPWVQGLEDGLASVRLLLEADRTGLFVDEVQRRFGNLKGFHLVLTTVKTALPRPPEPEKEEEPPPRRYGSRRGGLTREELQDECAQLARFDRVFIATVVLSTIVVAIGLLRDNAAVIIGAMVIAPLLGPNVALAFGTTLADGALVKRSLKANMVGVALALGITIVLGGLFRDHEFGQEVLSRTDVRTSDLVLALAAGSAGALALTTGVSSALVGVMVAVALLPPTAVVGLTLGRGAFYEMGQAMLLLGVNLIAVNLAATATFLVQGIRPRTWWQADKAKRSSRSALLLGAILLVILAVLIYITQKT